MILIKKDINIRFVDFRKIAFSISAILILAFIGVIFTRGFNLGIDFTGGVNIQIKFPDAINMDALKDDVNENYQGKGNVIPFGLEGNHEYMINIPSAEDEAENEANLKKVTDLLKQDYPEAEIRSLETIGPRVGGELKLSALYSILAVMAIILIYIGFRFQIFYGLAAILALIHDSLFIMGFFAVTGLTFDLTIVAALLTTIGYSLNDTVIIFDRIRENLGRHAGMDPKELVNMSINQTLSRTLGTSFTTLIVVLFLYLFGGPSINNFALAIILGILAGTYSTIYIAAPVLIYIKRKVKASAPTSTVSV